MSLWSPDTIYTCIPQHTAHNIGTHASQLDLSCLAYTSWVVYSACGSQKVIVWQRSDCGDVDLQAFIELQMSKWTQWPPALPMGKSSRRPCTVDSLAPIIFVLSIHTVYHIRGYLSTLLQPRIFYIQRLLYWFNMESTHCMHTQKSKLSFEQIIFYGQHEWIKGCCKIYHSNLWKTP